jgi:hypothetical protein|tara:strand:+ start:331 stop:468 length:138 start_codon:yes stop_codon:yes gene_type:complete
MANFDRVASEEGAIDLQEQNKRLEFFLSAFIVVLMVLSLIFRIFV